MNTTERTTVFGVNRKIARTVHGIMLFGMLHSTFVAPAQAIFIDYFNVPKPVVTKWGTFYEDTEKYTDEGQIIRSEKPVSVFGKTVDEIKTSEKPRENQVYYSDIEQGFIGLLEDKSLDDAKDNLFRLSILNIPQNAKGYLKYDLYGVEGIGSVSRSINDLPSTGGHIIKKNNIWTSQQEELDVKWLREGENTILFTAPSLKGYGYKIKNLRIEFAENADVTSPLVLNIDEKNLFKKDNKVYIKGFVNNAKTGLKVEAEDIFLSVFGSQFEGVIELTDKILDKRHLVVKAGDNNGLLGQEIIPLTNLPEADLFVPFEVNVNASAKLFPAFSGNQLHIEGAGIVVPDSALVERKNISISQLRKKDIAPLNSGLINVTKNGTAFRFLPDGTKFEKAAKILLKYDSKLIPPGYSEKDIKTFYFSTKTKSWVSIEKDSVDLTNKMIISNTDHFTDYINGIIQVPETPESSAFVPTMMSDIKAADPSAGITLISPPEVSQKGSAGVSYPIKVPAGRNGMQPSLAIQYNSDGGNGFLGQGWDISIPAITIDTRWGVPVLDNNYETEIYTLSGEQLMYPKIKNLENDYEDWMPNRHYIDGFDNGNPIYNTTPRARISNAVFTPRKQGSFAKIERLGANPTNYYWKVTDTNGTISWYGGKTAVVNNSVLRNSDNKVVYWSLYMVEDVFGNTMRYNYTNVNIPTISGVNANLQGGKYFHIRNIYYTGYNGSNEGYSVDFNPTSTSSTNVREDVTIDSRLGIKLVNSKRLSNIQVKQGSQVIRRYNLNYEFSKFQKYRVRYIAEANGSNQEFYRHGFEYYDDLKEGENDIYFSVGVDIDTCDEDEFEAPEPCYFVHPPNNNYLTEMAYIYYNGIPLQGNPFYLGNKTPIINALNAQFPGIFSYLNVNGVNRLMVTNLEEIPQTMTFIVNGEVFTSDFRPCPKYSHRLILSESQYSYNFSNSFPIGNPDCPSMVNAEFLIEGLIPSFNSYFSPLGSSSTKADSFGGYLGLIGAGCNWVSKNTTAGFGYNKSGNKTKSEISMVDINGDGLNDIVIQEGGSFKYRPHIVERTYDENGEEIITHSFGSRRPISGISNFYNSVGESEQYNFSFNSYISLGWEKSSSKSTTNVYFTDANGDGLIDIVKNGVVYFNRLNTNGNPHFYTDSEATENMVILAEPLSVVEPQEEEAEFILPSYDVVKVWEAPADGNIKIENNIQLTDPSKEAVVTIEMKPSQEPDKKCYSVSLPALKIQQMTYKYRFSGEADIGNGDSNSTIYVDDSFIIWGTCMNRSWRIKQLTLNGINYQPNNPNQLFVMHGNSINGKINQCPSTIPPIMEPYTIENYYNDDFLDTSVRSLNSATLIPTWVANVLSSANINSTNIIFNDRTGVYLRGNTPPSYYHYDYKNRFSYEVIFYSTESNITGGVINEYSEESNIWHNDLYNSNNFSTPISKTVLGNINVGIDTQVYINDNLLGTFNLYDNFSAFQNAFEAVYGSAHTIIPPSANNNYTITIKMYDSNTFNDIKLIPVSNPSQNYTYNFTITDSCEYNYKLISAEGSYDFSDLEPLKESKELAINKWLSEGSELNFPIGNSQLISDVYFENENDKKLLKSGYYSFNKGDKEYWTNDKGETITVKNAIETLNKFLPADINEMYIDLQKKYEIEEINSRKKAQQQAQEWLKENDMYRGYNEERYVAPTQKSLLSENSCGEIGDLCLLFGAKLSINNQSVNNTITSPSSTCNQGNDSLRVKKGDRIYFRVHSVEKGNPPINWDPKVSYTESQYNNVIDQNGYNVYSSNYSDGFILSESNPFTFPGKKGNVAISWLPFDVYQPSDDVIFKIIKRTVSAATGDIIPNSETELYKKTCTSSNPLVQAVNPINATVDLSDIIIPETDNIVQFLFIAESTSNVKWADYYDKWKPVITTIVTEDVIGESNQPEGTLTSTETYYPIIDYSLFKKFSCGPVYTTFDLSEVNGNISSISPNISSGIFTTGDYGKINFVVKNDGKLIDSRVLTVNNGSVSSNNNNPVLLQNLEGTKIEIGYYLVNDQENSGGEFLAAKLVSANNSTVKIGSYSVPNDKVNIYHRYNRFGPMYRQWGQFFYDPSKVEGAVPTQYGNLIKEEVLFQNYDTTAIQNFINIGEGINTPSNEVTENGIGNLENDLIYLQGQYESLIQEGGAFLIGRASRGDNLSSDRWIGLHEENYASQSSSRAASFSQVLSSDYEVEPYNYQGMVNTGALGINKVFRSKGKNISGGANYLGFGVSVSKSIEGSGKIVTDYTDLNGDRYPDIVTTEKVQFTTRTGGLKKPVNRTLQEEVITTNRNDNFGFGVSGGLGGNNNDQGAANSVANKISKIIESTKPNTSIGLSLNFSKGNSFTDSFWTDVNGDGLPDLIEKNGSNVNVYLNRGGKLESTPNIWNNLPNVFESNSTNIGGGIGLSLWNSSIQGGLSLTSSWNNTKNTFIDINGDGLVDFIDTDDNLGVRINTGNRFLDEVNWSSYDLERESVSATASKNFALTIAPNFGIPLTSLCIKAFAITGSYTRSTSTNKTMKMITDFDGDGYPDLIEKLSESGTKIRVYHSRIRRTDKLKSVTNPLGGKFTVDYKVHKVDYDNPNPKWVMSSVEIEDGYNLANDGHDVYRKEFVYENPRYDRRERDFYGFETIKTIDYTLDEEGEQDEIYRTSVTKYHNRSYFLNGLVKETAVYKGDMENNELYSKTENTYEIRSLGNDNRIVNTTAQGILPEDYDVGGSEGRRSAAVFLTGAKNYIYELGSSPIISESKRTYDFRGRLMWYDHFGDSNDPNDDYKTIILYQENQSLISKNIINIPLEVYLWVDGQAKRKSRADNINLNTGAIGAIRYFYTENAYGQVDLQYDQYGNITQIQYPENDNGQRMKYNYEYDTAYNKHVTKVTDAFGYISQTSYNFSFDIPIEVTDIAGNITRYEYDSFGRMIQVRGPKEIQSNKPYTIQFNYYPKYSDIQSLGVVSQNDFMPVALTKHYDEQYPNNTIDTYTFIDGLARPVQVKKDITVNMNGNPSTNPNYLERMSVSGAVTYDEFGRAVKQYHPLVENKANTVNFKYNNSNPSPNYFTQSIYDPLDRVIEAVDEEGNQSFMEYSVDGNLHKTRSVVQQTGSVNIISESFKDVNGRVVETNNVGPQGDIITTFNYNAMGELLSYTDDMDMTTEYQYDMLGRKIEMHHPDRGTTKYYYDKASNLTRLQTANLIQQNTFIQYEYEYNRLYRIIFPQPQQGPINIADVYYEYGSPNSGNQTGRLVFQHDASGVQEFEYGNMGELVYNRRTVVAPSPTLPTRTYETRFEYDSWNRLQQMTYPDGETVRYSYDLGGNLNGIHGDMPYVERVDYNHYGERTYIKYGNGTETVYDYTPKLRRLNNLQVFASNNQILLDNSYDYDKVGNVTDITNSAGIEEVNLMGGEYYHRYSYDNLNRLVNANGGFEGHLEYQQAINNDYQSDYELSMSYDSTHRIVNKLQNHNKNGQVFLPNTYDNYYEYYEDTHRVKQIIDAYGADTESFAYDLNGNITHRSGGVAQVDKYYFWDEADRLRIIDQKEDILHHYIYDAGGQRVLKASSYMEAVYENGQLVDSNIQMDNYTSYPSSFLVVDPDGIYSKHYYAGTQRIAARIGHSNADEIFVNAQPKSGQVSNSESTGSSFNADELKTLQRKDLQSYLDKAGKEARLSFKEYKPNTEEQTQEAPPSERAGEGSYAAYGAMAEDLIYYYHPDHLGTATYLTDINGNAYEFFLNLPFGETMAEQHSQTADYVNRWKFTGHELDRETGLYYANARYYDPKLSIFLSVDPLAEQTPDWTPYRYGFNNPIYYIDPDGRQEYPNSYKGELGKGDWREDDRILQTDVWKNANKHNLQQKKGYEEYKTIEQRADFYKWFQKTTEKEGYETKWAGAAYIIAAQMSNVNSPFASFIDNSVEADVIKFANDGNKLIFDDVFGRLKDLYNGSVLKGDDAKRWDAATLKREQFDVVEPLYRAQRPEVLNTLSKMAKGEGWMFRRGVAPFLRFDKNKDVRNPQHRYDHGMNVAVPAWNRMSKKL